MLQDMAGLCWLPIHVRSTEILGICIKHGEPYMERC